jgi:hypothetical protein
MQSFTKITGWAVVSITAIGTFAALSNPISVNAPAARPVAAAAVQNVVKPVVRAAVAAVNPVSIVAPVAAPKFAIKFTTEDSVRKQIKFETVRWGGKPVQTLDEASRILLAQAAAEKAGLHKVGLSYQDVYGVIEAETSWIQRTGASKDGTANLGLAQFEPRTAKGLGLKDPQDPVQAVFAAALYMKDGATWAAGKIGHLKLTPEQHAAKLREGVSVHYNLSIKGRNKWDGLNTADLPVETQRHIRNAVLGATEAAQLARQLNT